MSNQAKGPSSRLAIYDDTYKLKIAAIKLLTSDIQTLYLKYAWLENYQILFVNLNSEELGLGYSGC